MRQNSIKKAIIGAIVGGIIGAFAGGLPGAGLGIIGGAFLAQSIKDTTPTLKVLEAKDEITAEEVSGMKVEAAKQSLSRLWETEDFKKLLLYEKIYVVINRWPLSGPNGNFNIGPKASVEMAECIKNVIEQHRNTVCRGAIM